MSKNDVLLKVFFYKKTTFYRLFSAKKKEPPLVLVALLVLSAVDQVGKDIHTPHPLPACFPHIPTTSRCMKKEASLFPIGRQDIIRDRSHPAKQFCIAI
jgi:hypothetical protein